MTACIRLQDVSFRYPGNETDTLPAVNLEIASGERHALLGASGTGKTTLLNLLSGLLTATGGAIYFDDEEVTQQPGRARRVAQVFQFPVLYEPLTVRRNIAFPLRKLRFSAAELEARVVEVATSLGLEPLLDIKVPMLSLYEKQLVAVARALVQPDVRLVLLDEPLTAVQGEVKWRLRRTLKDAQRRLGVTMIYVTHDQTEALTFAQQVSVMHDGRILQTGTPGMIYEAPAHEYVGYFIGSPGMNLLDAIVRDGRALVGEQQVASVNLSDGPVRLGFRPEWSRLEPSDSAAGMLVSYLNHRVLGVDQGEPLNLATVRLRHTDLHVPCVQLPTDAAMLHIDRAVWFRDGARVA